MDTALVAMSLQLALYAPWEAKPGPRTDEMSVLAR